MSLGFVGAPTGFFGHIPLKLSIYSAKETETLSGKSSGHVSLSAAHDKPTGSL